MNASVIADPYLTDRAYSKGDLVMNNGYLYSALADMDAGEWDEAKWLRTNVAALRKTSISDIADWIDVSDSMVWRNGYKPTYTSEYSTLFADYSPSFNLLHLHGYRGVVTSSYDWTVGVHQVALDFDSPLFYGFFNAASIAEIPKLYHGDVYSMGTTVYIGRDINGGSNTILGTITTVGPQSSSSLMHLNGIGFKPLAGDNTSGYSKNKGFPLNDLYFKVTPKQ